MSITKNFIRPDSPTVDDGWTESLAAAQSIDTNRLELATQVTLGDWTKACYAEAAGDFEDGNAYIDLNVNGQTIFPLVHCRYSPGADTGYVAGWNNGTLWVATNTGAVFFSAIDSTAIAVSNGTNIRIEVDAQGTTITANLYNLDVDPEVVIATASGTNGSYTSGSTAISNAGAQCFVDEFFSFGTITPQIVITEPLTNGCVPLTDRTLVNTYAYETGANGALVTSRIGMTVDGSGLLSAITDTSEELTFPGTYHVDVEVAPHIFVSFRNVATTEAP